MSLTVELLILVGLVIATGFLSAAETAILSASKANLRRALKAGEPGAANALSMAETPTSFLLLVQLWLTLGGTIAGVLGGAELAADVTEHLQRWGVAAAWAAPLSFFLVAAGLASLMLVVGELIPKRIASAYPESTACRLAGTMRVLEWLTAPVTKVLSLFTGRLNRLMGSRQQAAPAAGDDEVRALVEQGLNAGVIHRAEKEMVDRVLALDNLRITSLMTPRPKIVFLNINDTDEANWRKIVASGHSYFPVYQGNRDHVVGMVAVKALWANSAIGLPAKLRDLVTPHLAVPDRITAIQLLEQFKKSGRHHAIVANEFGAVVGLVTLIDVLEAIVGDLPEAGMKNQPAARQRRDGTWLVDAELPVEDLKKLLKLEQPLPREGEADFKTIGGFLLSQFGRIPKETEHFDWSGWRFEVVDMDRLRIDKILVSRSPAQDPKSPEADSAPSEDGGQ
jgi:putative hemolysin